MDFPKLVLTLSFVALLAACGSSVKLDSASVEDRTNAAADGSGSALAARSAVPMVDANTAKPGAIAAYGRVVYFDYDSYAVKPDYQPLVENNARLLKSDKSRKAMIEGHTDDRGGREYNLALGQQRADAVRRALGLLGVAQAQMESVSFGKEKPAALGTDDTARAGNRRAEINIP
jgi:peptidoglycan-associated lipoprotein